MEFVDIRISAVSVCLGALTAWGCLTNGTLAQEPLGNEGAFYDMAGALHVLVTSTECDFEDWQAIEESALQYDASRWKERKQNSFLDDLAAQDEDGWNRYVFHNRFEILNMSWWHQDRIRTFLDCVDNSGKIFLHGWTDYAIRTLALYASEPTSSSFRYPLRPPGYRNHL